MEKKEIIYVGDPMCAWCFGFSNILDTLIETFQNQVDFSIVMGGLRVEEPIVADKEIRKMLFNNWSAVTRKTGQEISVHLLENSENFLYNSEPSSRAFTTVRKIDPDTARPYYKALHEAFYLGLKDITETDLLCHLGKNLGINTDEFTRIFESDAIRRETENDFSYAQNLGVLAFPSLVLKNGNDKAILNQGYKPLEPLHATIKKWIEGTIALKDIWPGFIV